MAQKSGAQKLQAGLARTETPKQMPGVYHRSGQTPLWAGDILRSYLTGKDDEVGRTFQYLNGKWSVELTGLSHAAPTGSWAVQFKPVNDLLAEPLHGAIWTSDFTKLSDDELENVLRQRCAR